MDDRDPRIPPTAPIEVPEGEVDRMIERLVRRMSLVRPDHPAFTQMRRLLEGLEEKKRMLEGMGKPDEFGVAQEPPERGVVIDTDAPPPDDGDGPMRSRSRRLSRRGGRRRGRRLPSIDVEPEDA